MEKTLLRVGLTGEMGAGKTHISKKFAELGVPIFNCDQGSKFLIMNSQTLRYELENEFGSDIYKQGESVFKNLGHIIFASNGQERLKIFMSIVEPFLMSMLDDFYNDYSDHYFCIIESDVLFEYDLDKHLDQVIYITASEEIRLKRTILRDKITEEEYRIRMKNQIDPEIKKEKCRFIIVNDNKSESELESEILKIYKLLTKNN